MNWSIAQRHDLWEGERCSWEQLRAGDWDKPRVLEVEPENGIIPRAMARRGCRVEIQKHFTQKDQLLIPALDHVAAPFPDLNISENPLLPSEPSWQQVRFGTGAAILPFLEHCRPKFIILRGFRAAEEVGLIKQLGYTKEAKILSKQWPAGGPIAPVIDYQESYLAEDIEDGEELYLEWQGAHSNQIKIVNHFAKNYQYRREDFTWLINEELENFIREKLPDLLPSEPTILELGPGYSTFVIKESLPNSNMISFEHSATFFRRYQGMMSNIPKHELIYAPLEPTLPWYSCSRLPEKAIDFLFIDGPCRHISPNIRNGALCLLPLMGKSAIIILDDADKDTELVKCLQHSGFEILDSSTRFVVLINRNEIAQNKVKSNQSISIDKIYVISLPSRKDRRDALAENWKNLGWSYEIIEGVTPSANDILWAEMKGMEAYGKAENLRTEYVVGAVGCKRAGIKALRAFLDSCADTAMICQDDCHWKEGSIEIINHAIAELPHDWDLLYFSASARKPHLPHSPHLAQLQGARLCTAILWNRKMAERIINDLEQCDCEWDLFMQKLHQKHNCYVAVPMPAYQAKSFSNITKSVSLIPNR